MSDLELERAKALALELDFEEEEDEKQLSPSGKPIQKGQTHFVNPETGRTEKLPESQQPSKEEMIESDPASGAMYGMVEGVPFAKDAMSAGKAAYDIASGKGENFGEAYEANMDQWNKEINLAEEKHPLLFMGGDIGAGIATMSPALKGLKGLGAAAMFGGASGLSRSEERTPSDFLFGASLGAGGDLLGKGVARLSQTGPMQNLGRKLGILADETTLDIIEPMENKKYLNKTLNKIYKTYDEATGKVEVPSPQAVSSMFADDLNNIVVRGEKLIDPADNMNTVVTKFRNLADDVDDTIGATLARNDIEVDEKTMRAIYEKHKASLGLDDMRATQSPKLVQQADELEAKLMKEYFDEPTKFTTVTDDVIEVVEGQPITRKVSRQIPEEAPRLKKMTVLDLHKRKRGYAELTNMDSQLASINQADQALYKRGAGVLSDAIPELLDNSAAFRELNKVSRIARLGKELTQKTNDTMAKGAMGKLKQAFNMRAAMMIGAGAAGGGPVGASVGFVVAQLSRASKDPTMNSKAAMYLRKVSNAIQNGTDGAYIKRLAVASSLSEAEFGQAVAGIASEVTLMESPIKRTYADIEDKSDFILESLQYHDPEQAKQLRAAFDNNDQESIRMVMDQVSKNPDMALMFEDGKGIDGRVFSEEDKQALKDEVEGMDVSLKQKLQHLDQLNKNGTIPQVQEEPERFFQPKWRNKDKPRY